MLTTASSRGGCGSRRLGDGVGYISGNFPALIRHHTSSNGRLPDKCKPLRHAGNPRAWRIARAAASPFFALCRALLLSESPPTPLLPPSPPSLRLDFFLSRPWLSDAADAAAEEENGGGTGGPAASAECASGALPPARALLPVAPAAVVGFDVGAGAGAGGFALAASAHFAYIWAATLAASAAKASPRAVRAASTARSLAMGGPIFAALSAARSTGSARRTCRGARGQRGGVMPTFTAEHGNAAADVGQCGPSAGPRRHNVCSNAAPAGNRQRVRAT